nr:alpha/beta hydrolase [Mesorhizobium loti]
MTLAKPFAVSADRTQLHAVDVGHGHPIVIVHGGMQQAALWGDVAERLTPRWRVVMLERRLYGRSGQPQSPHSMAREAEDIVAVLDEIGEPAVLLGHSSGGIAALEAALIHPLAGLMLYEAPVPLGDTCFGEGLAIAEAAAARGNMDEALRSFFVDIIGFPELWIEHMRDGPQGQRGWAAMTTMLPAQLEDVRAIRALPHSIDRYAAITAKTLLIEGELSPRHLSDRLAFLKTAIAGAESVTIAGHGHSANLEAPDRIALIMDQFAGRIFCSP